jgi:hypothetical protein
MLISVFICDPWRSLLVNLTATFLGSIATVFFIDRILRRREEQRWERVKTHVGKQVSILVYGVASSVRTALGIEPADAFDDPGVVENQTRLREVMTDFIERGLLPSTKGLSRTNQDGWRTFAANLRNAIFNCDRLISLFGINLDPRITGMILDLQEQARAVLAPYEILPDMLGVPSNQLRPNRRGQSSARILQAMVQGTIRNTDAMLRSCATLLREIGRSFPEQNPASPTS